MQFALMTDGFRQTPRVQASYNDTVAMRVSLQLYTQYVPTQINAALYRTIDRSVASDEGTVRRMALCKTTLTLS